MNQPSLTPDAKALLSSTIRALRARLVGDLLAQAEGDFRLSVPAPQARLPETQARRRATLDAWVDERLRASKGKTRGSQAEARAAALREAALEVAATWLNRLVLLRHLEAVELSRPRVVTGGWKSPGYREFRDFGPALLTGDETEGYALLLRLLFEEHALDLPGLFGEVGLERLLPLPAATLRELVERLDDKGLESAWKDDTTLGWVYQYWNDPEREALDKKITEGGKIEPGEIASKTQMFTERYMVEWLLQNSLGTTWLCICKKNGWQADALQVLPGLEARRAAWRARREAGEVALDALMPIEGELEDFWKYHVPQPLSPDAIARAPASIAELKLLDPACGSGHFLVIAFDLLAAMHREEARHRGVEISDQQIALAILENNLFGVDIDPRAVQIAAAALLLKARRFARDARPRHLNLVAPALKLANLPATDPTVVQMQQALLRDCAIPLVASSKLFKALEGVDHLGTLLKVDRSIDEVIEATRRQLLLGEVISPEEQREIGTRESILGKLEAFLARHTSEDDLGLRLDGEQLAQGIRFLRIVRENTYDIVIGNPPYQGTPKMADASYVAAKYTAGKADLYAAFLLRGLELAREGGLSALLTMRGWMFQGQYEVLRKHLLHGSDLRALIDLDSGAFGDVSAAQVVLSVAAGVFNKQKPSGQTTLALRPTPTTDRASAGMLERKQAGLLAQVGRYEFDTRGFEAIEGEPMVYWWSPAFLSRYKETEKMGKTSPARQGMPTTNNSRYLRRPWEIQISSVKIEKYSTPNTFSRIKNFKWVPYVGGAEGACWFESLDDIVLWNFQGLELKVGVENEYGSVSKRVQNEKFFFTQGIAFAMIGSNFFSRTHRFSSIFGNKGSSVFPENINATVCFMNNRESREILESLNPGIGFEVGDVNRLPLFPVEYADEIFSTIERAFSVHEAAREASVEFRQPGPSPWRYAQAWAQRAVDRPAGEPLPAHEEELNPPAPMAFVSFAFGVALGRFGANGEGILEKPPATALPGGILFLSSRADEGAKDSLDQPACQPLREAWATHGGKVGEGDDLRTYLRKGFFAHVKDTYESRPIYFPLSSRQKSFVAWVSIHRWEAGTLQTLIADFLVPERRAIDAELEELRKARVVAEGKQKAAAGKRYEKLTKLADELEEFLSRVAQCADKGPPQAEREPAREVDAPHAMDLDDGVMVNSAALWPLLEPQWKDPKKWWKELASAQGRKDYDWSHLAARYFPRRVADKCLQDPSLAVAHGCFWRLHPAKAYAWELRLQDEIRTDFTIDEPGSDEARARFLAEHQESARELEAKELQRRERKADKQADPRAAGELPEVEDEPEDGDEAEND